MHDQVELRGMENRVRPVPGRRTLLAALAVVATGLCGLAAADWPTWRGPNRDGISEEADWNPDGIKKTLWQKEVGAGWTAVTVAQGRLFVMGNQDGAADTVYCLDPVTGAERWTTSYPCTHADKKYPGPRATPVTDGERVYAFSVEGHLSCFDAKTGKQVWQRQVRELQAKAPTWKFASAPLLLGQMVVVNAGDCGVALDRLTGKDLWGSAGDGSYASPVPFNRDQAIALFVKKALVAVEAKTGKQLWSQPWETKYDVNAPDPLPIDGKIFITSDYGRGCAMIDVSGSSPKILWENKAMASHFASPVYFDGVIIGIDGGAGKGQLTCLDPKDGKVNWKGDMGFGSFVIAGKRLIYLNEKGEVTVGDVSAQGFKRLVSAQVLTDAGKCWTMPVLANGLLYCRGSSGKMVCLDLRK